MKNYKLPYIISGCFGAVGLVLWIIVICEKLFSKTVSPSWVKTLQIIGLIAFAVALLILIAIVVVASIEDKKTSKTVKATDEEILSKYKSKKSK